MSTSTAATAGRVLVVDGYGVRLSVRRGQLVIEDGMGRERQTREVSRIERTLRRVVVLADTGSVSLDAVRWCADVGISLVQLDRNGRLLLTAKPVGTDDARLRRAQAAAPSSDTGLGIAKALLAAKIEGQAAVLDEHLAVPAAADRLDQLTADVRAASDLAACRSVESQAGNIYFGAWARWVTPTFASQHADQVPGHWHRFTTRRSPRATNKSAIGAADPVNALLNYGYALAEVECRLAAIALGLDPGMGIVHTDQRNRDSLALDLLEPLRPLVDQQVLRLLASRHLSTNDLYESRDGQCRLLPPLTGWMCEHLPVYAAAVAPLAEHVAHTLARSSPGKVTLRTPLSRSRHLAAQESAASARRRRAPAVADLPPTCRNCGATLYDRRRQLCSTCWGVHRGGSSPITEEQYSTQVQPGLAAVGIKRLCEATGLSPSMCSRVRSGSLTPHPRHWVVLADLAAAGSFST